MNALGIYFGPKSISIVEVKKRKILNNIQIPNSDFLADDTEDKVPEELKISALFKDRFRKYNITSNVATITLSGRDLIIRTFEIPVLPANELPSAINFEVKKYIPFKIEELVYNFQVQRDRNKRVYSVLFVGIKKEILEKYFLILEQVGIKIISIEYSAFSILRLVQLSNSKEKGVIALIDVDDKERDEANFTVTENGFPLFSCDIKLGISENAIIDPEKLKIELRISLDYYNHKFPAKRIKHVFFIGNPNFHESIGTFMRELDFSFKFIDSSRVIYEKLSFNLGFLKAYSSALSGNIKTNVKMNLLAAWQKSKQLRNPSVSQRNQISLSSLLSGVKLNPFVAASAALVLLVSYIQGASNRAALEKDLSSVLVARPIIPKVNAEATIEELEQIKSQDKQDISVMDSLVRKQLFLTPHLAAIPELIPEGMWLEDFSFTNFDKPEFTLKGMVYLGNNNKELELIDNFLSLLKKDRNFSKNFKQIALISVESRDYKDKPVTYFTISGRS